METERRKTIQKAKRPLIKSTHLQIDGQDSGDGRGIQGEWCYHTGPCNTSGTLHLKRGEAEVERLRKKPDRTAACKYFRHFCKAAVTLHFTDSQ